MMSEDKSAEEDLGCRNRQFIFTIALWLDFSVWGVQRCFGEE